MFIRRRRSRPTLLLVDSAEIPTAQVKPQGDVSKRNVLCLTSRAPGMRFPAGKDPPGSGNNYLFRRGVQAVELRSLTRNTGVSWEPEIVFCDEFCQSIRGQRYTKHPIRLGNRRDQV